MISFGKKFKNIFYLACLGFCLGVFGLCSLITSPVYADTTNREYFLAQNGEKSYNLTSTAISEGQTKYETVFLGASETLNISLGKPSTIITGNYTDVSEIGDYALTSVRTSLSINGQTVSDIGEYVTPHSFNYQPIASGGMLKEFEYIELNIDLDSPLYESGKYQLTFNYLEHSGINYSTAKEDSFSVTFFVYKTTDYFTNGEATSQKVTFTNLEKSSPLGNAYKNYYFFNYANQATDSTALNLPTLVFDSSKFYINLEKSIGGQKNTCSIDKGVISNSEATSNFVSAVYNASTKMTTVMFSDLGEYTIEYIFISENTSSLLTSTEIDSVSAKKDVLYVYGYQMFYNGNYETPNNEFRQIIDNKSSLSADVTYLLSKASLTNSNASTLSADANADANNNDSRLINILKSKTAVSTNQPAVSTFTNTILESAKYYTWDNATNDFLKNSTDKYVTTSYADTPFASSGTYLLKVVYKFSNYYNLEGNRASSMYFAQYFYFTITNTIPTFSVNDDNGALGTNSFTKLDTTLTLNGQSLFNSKVQLTVEGKEFGTDKPYYNVVSLNESTSNQTRVFSADKNYKVTLKYGKNLSKSETSYFTIDKSGFTGINVIPVTKSQSSSGYIEDKNHIVDFFTSENVVLEWSEKASGASSTAFYKYIPFKKVTLEQLSFGAYNALATDYALDFDITQNLSKSKYKNTKNTTQITGSQVFTNQGFYIIKIIDEAGNESNVYFCIDKTKIQVRQLNKDGQLQTVQNYNVVNENTKLQWGTHKLIDLGFNVSDLPNIVDTWALEAFNTLYYGATYGTAVQVPLNDNIRSKLTSPSKLFFAVEISRTKILQKGAEQSFYVNDKIDETLSLTTTYKDTEFALEITYVYYFLDESNKYFKDFNITSSTSSSDIASITNNSNITPFVTNASLSYDITMTSDASGANVVINDNATSIGDVLNISSDSYNLFQAGFTDSITASGSVADLRTKFYMTTGYAITGNVPILTYIFKINAGVNLVVSNVTMYFYPFVNDETVGVRKLSATASKTVLYETGGTLPNALNSSFGDGLFYGFNIHIGTNQMTQGGKYIIVRQYSTTDGTELSSSMSKFDFSTRESVFIVDRDEVVSSPETYETSDGKVTKSFVGGDIYINVLDSDPSKSVKFNNIYASQVKNSYLLQTNKLPVAIYIPITKYGERDASFTDTFNPDKIRYYFQTQTEDNIEYLLRYNESVSSYSKSKLTLGYFGNTPFDTAFAGNTKNNYNGFELSVVVKDANGNIIPNFVNEFGFYKVTNIYQAGTYYIEITQNAKNGSTYPNEYRTFEFKFEIISTAPEFAFVDKSTNSSFEIEDGVTYTNKNDVRITWTDPAVENKFLAKIDKTKISYYFTNIGGSVSYSPIITLPTANIKNVEDTTTYYFDLDITAFREDMGNNYVLNVYMQYENFKTNFPNYSVTRQLFIDRQAPSSVINDLIASSSIDNIDISSSSRIYINDSGQETTSHLYSFTKNSGTYAYYSYAVEINEAKISNMFSLKPAINGYYSDGAYYHLTWIKDFESYKTNFSYTSLLQTFKAYMGTSSWSRSDILQYGSGQYYEVVEADKAGNISVYLIYFTPNFAESNVLEFEKTATTLDATTAIKYKDILPNQDIYAINNFDVTNINLYDYDWLTFSVNDIIFVKHNNIFYDFTHNMKVVTQEQILNFSASSKNVIKIVDPCKSTTYTFNVHTTNDHLNATLLPTGEGIEINSITGEDYNVVKLFPTNVKIYSFEGATFTLIYDMSTFASNEFVTFTQNENLLTFTITNPNVAYKYEITDNYGRIIYEYHTKGDKELTEDQKIIGISQKINITEETSSDVFATNEWAVGLKSLTYNYNSSEFSAFINIFTLKYNSATKAFYWEKATFVDLTFDAVKDGYLIRRDITNNYLKTKTSGLSSLVTEVTINPSDYIADLPSYTGGVVKVVINLVNNRDNANTTAMKTDRLLINTLKPVVKLIDKYGEDKSNDLFTAGVQFTGELTAEILSADFTKTINNLDNVSQFALTHSIELAKGTSSTTLLSNTIISEPGTYFIKNYIRIGDVDYLTETKSFVISKSSNAFYTVVAMDKTTNAYEIVNTTGEPFNYSTPTYNITYYNHYIINTHDFKVLTNANQCIRVTNIQEISNGNYIYTISNMAYISDNTIQPYETKIVITIIEPVSDILTTFKSENATTNYTGISTQIMIDKDNSNIEEITLIYNSYYLIPENKITVTIYYGEGELIVLSPTITYLSNGLAKFTVSKSGIYTLSFKDIAGNVQYFKDTTNNYFTDKFTITFIKGVAYLINDLAPIENGIYNDKVTITLPNILKTIYDTGNKPAIVVVKNGQELLVKADEDGKYILNQVGYYEVYFDAKISGKSLRQEIYSFTILSSEEYRTSFEFSEYGDYEIVKILKDDVLQDYSNLFTPNSNGNLTNFELSLYDKKTGVGSYEVIVKTNSEVAGETFTFKFKIKAIGAIPIEISSAEGQSTTKAIKVSFNAFDLYTDIGECKVKFGDQLILINKEYIESLSSSSYYQSFDISDTGTYFVQVLTSSDKLVFSYKVIKTEPLNAVSIILIVVGVVAVVGLVVTVSLLRRRMKIR